MNSSAPTPPAPAGKRRPHVLVVEDAVFLRFTLAEWLRRQDYQVLEAASADEAMAILNSYYKVDLVITDVEMPGSMNGIAFARHISKAFPAVKIIVVTGGSHTVSPLEKAVPFFRKPYDLSAIAWQVKQLLAQKYSSNPESP